MHYFFSLNTHTCYENENTIYPTMDEWPEPDSKLIVKVNQRQSEGENQS